MCMGVLCAPLEKEAPCNVLATKKNDENKSKSETRQHRKEQDEISILQQIGDDGNVFIYPVRPQSTFSSPLRDSARAQSHARYSSPVVLD